MLPTYEQALAITEASEAFYVQTGEIGGFQYAMFNYRMAMYEDFINEKWDARELRGLTYIYNEHFGEWEIHPMLTKFWNLNENVSTQYGVVKDKEIDSIEYKEDGSLITFVSLPDGSLVPKTKMSFDNDQTTMVKNWMQENASCVKWLKENLHLSYLFELVSPRNKIVLKYTKTELRLLQIRSKLTGEYCTSEELESQAKLMGVPLAETFIDTLDGLIAKRETEEDLEGWVIKFKDGQFIKLKTEWYVAAHGLMNDLSQENKVIEMILEETIDDVLAELEEGCEEREYIEEIIQLVDVYYNHRVQTAYDLRDRYFNEFGQVRKDFAIACSRLPDFGIVMKNLEGDGIADAVKERMKTELSHLEKAREFIDKLKG